MPNFKKIIEYFRTQYNQLACVICPILNHSNIYFTAPGFKHLIWKGLRRRKYGEILSRLLLFEYVCEIIQSQQVKIEYRSIQTKTRTIEYWGLTKYIKNIKITVVIRQIGNGRKHFYSIFKRNKTYKTKSPP